MRLLNPSRVLLLTGGLAVLAGCRPAPTAPAGGSERKADLKSAALVVQRAPDADEAVEQALKLLPRTSHGLTASGVGVVVCDPAAGAPEALQDFGRGCSRWLHLHVAGHPQANLTPHLHSVSRARRQLAQLDLALAPEEVRKLGAPLGVNRVITSALEGSPDAMTLTYQVHSLPDGKPVGSPIELKGNRDDVVARLPEAARALCGALKLRPELVPPAVELKAEELAAVGAAWWAGKRTGLSADRISASALLALVEFPHCSGKELAEVVGAMARRAPDNPLVYAAVGYAQASELLPLKEQVLSLRRRYPKSYAAAHSEVWLRRVMEDPKAEMAAAKAVIRNAPRNPDAWLSFAYTQSDAAQALRQGRFAAEISDAEWRKLHQDYGLWVRSAAEAVRLDRNHVRAWVKVASSATFAGEEELAEAALWSAIKLEPDTLEAYTWGLQMYQPKWLDKPDQLRKVAEAAAARDWPLELDLPVLAVQIQEAGLNDVADQFSARCVERYRQAVAAEPDDLSARMSFGQFLNRTGSRIEARREYEEVLRRRPDLADAHFRLAESFDKDQRLDRAIEEYRKGLKLDPTRAVSHYDLGWALKLTGKLPEAESSFREAVRLKPRFGEAHYGLGQLYTLRQRPDLAIASYRKAIASRPGMWEAYRDLSQALAQKGRHQEAIAMAKTAVQFKPEDRSTLNALGYAYGMANRLQESAEVCRKILELSPGDPIAQVNLGESLMKLGQKAEAREVLEEATRSGHEPVVKEARRLLAAMK